LTPLVALADGTRVPAEAPKLTGTSATGWPSASFRAQATDIVLPTTAEAGGAGGWTSINVTAGSVTETDTPSSTGLTLLKFSVREPGRPVIARSLNVANPFASVGTVVVPPSVPSPAIAAAI
jgi:hypothetical protein